MHDDFPFAAQRELKIKVVPVLALWDALNALGVTPIGAESYPNRPATPAQQASLLRSIYFAPACSSIFTISPWPRDLANCSGVLPWRSASCRSAPASIKALSVA